jgi:hypothetical protein
MTPTPRTPKLQVELIPLKNSKLKLGCLATSSILFSGSHRSVSIVFFFHNRAVSLLRSRRPTPGGVGGGGLRCPRVAPRRPCTGTAPPLDSPAAALHRWPYGLDNPSNGLVSASIRPLDGHVALHFPFALWPPQMALPPLAPFSPPLLGSLPSADRRAPSRRRSRGGPRGGMWWRHGGEGGLQCGSRLSGRGGPWRRPAASRAEDKFGASGISQA